MFKSCFQIEILILIDFKIGRGEICHYLGCNITSVVKRNTTLILNTRMTRFIRSEAKQRKKSKTKIMDGQKYKASC